jgi:hypothetical protein
MSNFHIDQQAPVVWVDLNDRGDYGSIQYSPDFNWVEHDKKLIESAINEFYNSYDAQGEKIVNSTFGEVVIRHEKHPYADRRKLIRGFFTKEPIKANKLALSAATDTQLATGNSQIYAFIKEISPDFVKNDKRASEYLEKLLEEVKLSSIPSNMFQLEVFNSLLNAMETSANEHISDTSTKQRLLLLIKMVKTFFPAA